VSAGSGNTDSGATRDPSGRRGSRGPRSTGSAAGLGRRFARHPHGARLLRHRSRVLVALSGGLDSVCLLHLLRFGGDHAELHAAHYDHAMRPDSAADAGWVRGLCTAWGVPLSSERADPPPRGEAAARELRYAFLHEAAARCGADAIVTAHHADDQAETVLFRMARGTGLRGLAGIPTRRGLLVRPLLPFTRAELLAHAHRVGLRWREDSTNLDLSFARNRVRHVVMPALEVVRPGAVRRIERLARQAAEAERAWTSVVSDVVRDVLIDDRTAGFVLARDRLLAYHPHVRARVLRHLLQELGSEPGRAGTRYAAEFISSGSSGSWVELPGRVRLEREFDCLLLRPDAGAPAADVPLEIAGAAAGEGAFRVGGRSYAAQWVVVPAAASATAPAAEWEAPAAEWEAPASAQAARVTGGGSAAASFDLTSLRFPLTLRGWRAGDRIRLAYGSKKLKKLFQEHRVGRARRATTAVLHDGADDVLWVVGIARSGVALPQHGNVFTLTVTDGESL
jgi:tRNA(Ile)-lysidine synthase